MRRIVAVLVLASACVLGVPTSGGAQVEHVLTMAVGPPRVVSGDGCNWAEGPQYPNGSWVWLEVSTYAYGDGRISAPQTFFEGQVPTDAPGHWEQIVPKAPLAEPPPWATEVRVRAEATCHFAIGNAEFDYQPVESSRSVARGPRPSTTTTVAPGVAEAAPAQAVAGSPDLTG